VNSKSFLIALQTIKTQSLMEITKEACWYISNCINKLDEIDLIDLILSYSQELISCLVEGLRTLKSDSRMANLLLNSFTKILQTGVVRPGQIDV